MICLGERVRWAMMFSVMADCSSAVGDELVAGEAEGVTLVGLARPNGSASSPPEALTKILGKTSFITFGRP